MTVVTPFVLTVFSVHGFASGHRHVRDGLGFEGQ